MIDWLLRDDAPPSRSLGSLSASRNSAPTSTPAAGAGTDRWLRRFADRMFALTEEAALAYGAILGEAA